MFMSEIMLLGIEFGLSAISQACLY